ncbi:MAG: histidine kinase dimerization/phospho-acceptor domain-containing protein [Desulfocapsaceae bacterium]|nr:histidine kinase dimerization/phospho-acceptor domain-containing protein [Desulfocapsaceae bacterium]
MEEKILTSMNIERLVLEIDSGMDLARRLNGDFFLHAQHVGIAAAHKQYAQPSVREAARVIALSNELRDLLYRSQSSQNQQAPQVDLNLYLSMAKRFTETSIHAVELVTKRDIPVNGLVDQMTSSISIFGASLASHTDLLALHLKAKGFFQEYLINHQRPIIQSSFNVASSLHLAIINDQAILPEEKTALLVMLNQCRSIAEEIVAIDQEIKGAFNDFTIQSATTRMTSQSLLQFAQKETCRNHEKIHFAHKAVLIEDLVSTLEEKVVQRAAQLGESEQRFRYLAANLPLIPVQGYDCDRNIIFWNRASESVYGYTAAEAMGREIEDLIIPQSERAKFVQTTSDWLDLDIAPSSSEVIRCHENGSLVDVYSSHVMLTNTKSEKEMYGIDIDLAEIKQVQKEKATIEERLQRAQKMEAIGLMAGGVAHDLNNILSGIVGYLDLILMQWPTDNKLKALVEPIKESGKRAAAIVADLLTVARGVASVMETKELNVLIEEYIRSPEGKKLKSLYSDIRFESHIETRKSAIFCSPTHIKKCLMNLMINAAEAISGPGRITISTCEQAFDVTMAENKGLAPGSYVVLTVRDSGTGISADDLARIFEPFYIKRSWGEAVLAWGCRLSGILSRITRAALLSAAARKVHPLS